MRQHRTGIALGMGLLLVLLIPVATALGSSDPGPRTESRVFAATAVGNSFSFQGRLTDGGNPANGNFDLRFIMFDAVSGGVAIGQPAALQTTGVLKDDVAVTNGAFAVELDFGDVFNGDERWIEIAVRPGATTGTYTVLSPRLPVGATPYALFAKKANVFGVQASGSAAAALDLTNTNTTAPANGIVVTTHGGVAVGGIALASSGTSAAVDGLSKSATGQGGHFWNDAGGTGLKAETIGNGTALEIGNGALRVSGSARTAFQYIVPANAAVVPIDHPLTNGDPTAILFITHVVSLASAVGSNAVMTAVGVAYDTALSKWVIFTENASPLVAGIKFNVLVIKSQP